MEYKILPSIFAANFANLGADIKVIEDNDIDMIHVDIMDGHFVEKMAFGPDHLKALRKMTDVVLDVHLMVEKPERILDEIIEAGADIITLHVESSNRLYSCLEKIKRAGKKAGVVISPQTSESTLKYLLDTIDQVLVMTINPGENNFGFNHVMLEKISNVKEMIGNRQIDIEVDGNIDNTTIKLCKDAGANLFVVGGYIFKGDIKERIEKLRL